MMPSSWTRTAPAYLSACARPLRTPASELYTLTCRMATPFRASMRIAPASAAAWHARRTRMLSFHLPPCSQTLAPPPLPPPKWTALLRGLATGLHHRRSHLRSRSPRRRSRCWCACCVGVERCGRQLTRRSEARSSTRSTTPTVGPLLVELPARVARRHATRAALMATLPARRWRPVATQPMAWTRIRPSPSHRRARRGPRLAQTRPRRSRRRRCAMGTRLQRWRSTAGGRRRYAAAPTARSLWLR
mmetsp:Transcript_10761/g.27935  ORF Transcript_10761/g.27935 Transcript_10761/m.27935 type:complete len:246 (+) Transcript_10761:290-1027(+)